jgi:AbrB family looped-hinge helix DNA binding protein
VGMSMIWYDKVIFIIRSYTLANKVGEKGQVVIDKAIRDQLGIGPGWLAIQRIVDNHVEIYFVTPEHNRSLAGSLARYVTADVKDLSWHEIKEMAWTAAALEKEGIGTEVYDRRS